MGAAFVDGGEVLCVGGVGVVFALCELPAVVCASGVGAFAAWGWVVCVFVFGASAGGFVAEGVGLVW